MAIVGIGVDVVAICRIEQAYQRFGERFLNRFFTDDERSFSLSRAKPMEHLAVCFATKEAFFKACKGKCHLRWREIELAKDNRGLPKVELYGNTKGVAKKLGIKNILVSISHDAGVGISTVILES